ncbi:MAG: hypothetical protein ACLQDF_04145 [Desulfomonilia bacterium]
MKKRFVVALDTSTEEQNDKFIEYIKENEMGWWHWISNFWLLTDTNDKVTAEKLRDDLLTIYPGVTQLVLEFRKDNDTWSGFGPKSDTRNMYEWLHNNWFF